MLIQTKFSEPLVFVLDKTEVRLHIDEEYCDSYAFDQFVGSDSVMLNIDVGRELLDTDGAFNNAVGTLTNNIMSKINRKATNSELKVKLEPGISGKFMH